MDSLILQPYKWSESTTDSGRLELRAWCHTKESERALLRIVNFPYFIRLELPKIVDGVIHEWSERDLPDLLDSLKFLIGGKEFASGCIVHYNFKLKPNLYYCDDYSYILTLFFDYKKFYTKCINLLKNPLIVKTFCIIVDDNGREKSFYRSKYRSGLNIKVWENDISIITKFTSVKNIQECQWLECNGIIVPDNEKKSILSKEIMIDHNSLKGLDITHVVEPVIMGLDIETNSGNILKFPNPNYLTDEIFMITLAVQSKGVRKKFCIFKGDCGKPNEDAELIKCNNELEIIAHVVRISYEFNVTLWITYNGISFDYMYMFSRLSLFDKEWPKTSLLEDDKTWLYMKEWRSNAYGINYNYIPMTEGIIHVDMMLIIKRNYKLDEFNLKFVCKHFLKDMEKYKLELDYKEMFILYQNMIKQIRKRKKGLEYDQSAIDAFTVVVDYGIRDSDLCIDLFINLNTWIDLVESCNVFAVNNMIEMYTKGAQSKGINQIYKKCYKKGYTFNFKSSDINKFDGAKVFEPLGGIRKNCIFMDFKSMYPNIARAYNFSWDTFIPKNKWHLYKEDQYTEIKVPCGETIHVFRFLKGKGLLYEMLTELLDSRAKVRQDMKGIKDPTILSALNARQNALKIGANGLYGLTGMKEESGGRLTMLPIAMSITYLGKQDIQKAADHMCKKYGFIVIYGDTDSCCLYNEKLITNPSLCAPWGRVACHEINGGEATYIKELDMHLPKSDGIFSDRVNKTTEIDYEKGCVGEYIKKKNYFIIHINKEGTFPIKISSVINKGNVSARRLECDYVRNTIRELHFTILVSDILYEIKKHNNMNFYEMIDKTYNKENPFNFDEEVKKYKIDRNKCVYNYPIAIYEILLLLRNKIKKLLCNEIGLNDLVRRMNMGSNYAKPNYPLRLLSERLESIGKQVLPGSRLNLLVIKFENEDPSLKVGHKYVMMEGFTDSLKTDKPMKIDKEYYLFKALAKPFDTSFKASYEEVINKHYSCIQFTPKRKRTPITLSTPAMLFYYLIKEGHKVDHVLEMVDHINREENLL